MELKKEPLEAVLVSFLKDIYENPRLKRTLEDKGTIEKRFQENFGRVGEETVESYIDPRTNREIVHVFYLGQEGKEHIFSFTPELYLLSLDAKELDFLIAHYESRLELKRKTMPKVYYRPKSNLDRPKEKEPPIEKSPQEKVDSSAKEEISA